jgi:hypothetical protein
LCFCACARFSLAPADALVAPADEAERSAAALTAALTELPARRDGSDDERLQARAPLISHFRTHRLDPDATFVRRGGARRKRPRTRTRAQPLLDGVEELHCFVVLNYIGARARA